MICKKALKAFPSTLHNFFFHIEERDLESNLYKLLKATFCGTEMKAQYIICSVNGHNFKTTKV